MEDYVQHAVTVVMGFFAVMNPVANTPLFLGLTADDDAATRKAVARRALVLTFAIIVVFCAAGRLIFELFGITLIALRLAGGFIVFLIGLHMLQGEHSSAHKPSAAEQQASREAKLSIAVSPLAVPLLAGPGTIATAMNFVSTGGVYHVSVTIVAFFVLCVVTYLFFISGERLIRYLGAAGINAVTRLMGLILAVVGMQMVLEGVSGFVATLK